MQAVTLQNLSKTYPGGQQAVKQLELSLDQGEVFGFLGPNGAGKTTTVKLLNGMLTPTDGGCRVFNMDPVQTPEKVHAISGVVTEHAQMYDNLTGLQNLLFYGSVFGLSAADGEKRAKFLLEQLELSAAGDRKLATYSTGMRQRLSLARALMHRPKVLFLDEPTSGLDPESTQNVNQIIKNLAAQEGVTVFLCTHQLRYAQEICTRYGLIEAGELLACGTLEELCSDVLSGLTLCVRAQKMPNQLPFRETGKNQFEMDIESENVIPQIVRKIVENGGEIYAIKTKQPTLEDIYFALTAKEKEEAQ